ncbi:MAG: glycosyl transferase family 90 [Bacteroides sp.]|nr:glycosyl transferase family 90 [Roseburia sp.]MCM1345820.1 glycosyl transferase family 90 [Bacteroides sp.]MCM1421285.1 glycosyl transferase family 90 [Bacteroides sp.]
MNTNYIQVGRWLSRINVYISGFLNYAVPNCIFRIRKDAIMSEFAEKEDVRRRTEYYCRLSTPYTLERFERIGTFKFPFRKKGKRHTKYFFDLYETLRHFHPDMRFKYLTGDITTVPEEPAFVKSRPIQGDNANSVVLKLNKWRHFLFVEDKIPFRKKKDMIVSRTTWANANPLRKRLNDMFCNHPMCNIGKTRREKGDANDCKCIKEYLTIKQQLEYKFIACIEGGDVATSLKWVMSSNSIAVTPRPKYETWFMEGTLIPDYHYIEVKTDYSDLIEKLNYYIAHPHKAEEIIRHAHEYVSQFKDKKRERAIQLMVAEKYFQMTN